MPPSGWQQLHVTADTPLGLVETPLLRSHRLVALGEVAMGIAHEINTPLGIIGQEVELLRHILCAALSPAKQPSAPYPPLPPAIEESLTQLDQQVRRCSEVVRSLLSLTRGNAIIPQSVDAVATLDGMALLLEREMNKHGICIQRLYPRGALPVVTDPPLLRQAVLNIINNAAQAIRTTGREGKITLSIAHGQSGIISGTADTEWAFSVRDTGCGISSSDLECIFNPFFTTKGCEDRSAGKPCSPEDSIYPAGTGSAVSLSSPNGTDGSVFTPATAPSPTATQDGITGSGMGLTITASIVARLGGRMEVASALNEGALFTVRLPLVCPGAAQPNNSTGPTQPEERLCADNHVNT